VTIDGDGSEEIRRFDTTQDRRLLGIGVADVFANLIPAGPFAGRRSVGIHVSLEEAWWRSGSSSFEEAYKLINKTHPVIESHERILVGISEVNDFGLSSEIGRKQIYDFMLESPHNMMFIMYISSSVILKVPVTRVHVTLWPLPNVVPLDAMLVRADSLVLRMGPGGFDAVPDFALEFKRHNHRPVYLAVACTNKAGESIGYGAPFIRAIPIEEAADTVAWMAELCMEHGFILSPPLWRA